MVYIKNTLNSGTHDTNVTLASTSGSGDVATYLQVNNVAKNGGDPAILYTNARIADGLSPVTVKVKADTPWTFLRWDFVGESTRLVMRRAIYTPSNIASITYTPIWTRNATGLIGALKIYNGRPSVVVKSTDIVASRGSVLPANTLIWAELAITPESTEGANDGVIEYQITDNAGVSLLPGGNPYVNSGASVRASFVNEVHLGFCTDTAIAGYEDFIGEIQIKHLATGWLGPIGTPLAFPSAPTITAHTRPSAPGATDGSITVSWPVVPNANSYEAYLAKDTADPVLVSASVTSPYVFSGLSAGEYEPFIQAKP